MLFISHVVFPAHLWVWAGNKQQQHAWFLDAHRISRTGVCSQISQELVIPENVHIQKCVEIVFFHLCFGSPMVRYLFEFSSLRGYETAAPHVVYKFPQHPTAAVWFGIRSCSVLSYSCIRRTLTWCNG